ncbi:MAG: ABC transporter ATP-binding protein [Bacillota bacterium]
MAEIRFSNVVKRFGEVTVIPDFSATIQDGEFVSFLGPSGCGKTTMLRILAGFEKLTDGEVYLGGRLVSGPNLHVPPEQRDIGMVFQSYAVWPHMNVFDNVAYPLRVRKVSKEEVQRRVMAVLEMVHLHGLEKRFPSQLSGGQQQRVALARAVVAEPKLLLLDEPLSNLDAKLREAMRFELKEIQRRLGITVLYVTHDQTEAMAMSDRILVMNKGVIEQEDAPARIYDRPKSRFVADFVGLVNFLEATVDPDGALKVGEELSLRVDLPAGNHQRVLVSIRPEHIRLRREGSGIGTVAGVVERRFYLGDRVDYFVQAAGQQIRVTGGALEESFVEGDRVVLHMEKAFAFPL